MEISLIWINRSKKVLLGNGEFPYSFIFRAIYFIIFTLFIHSCLLKSSSNVLSIFFLLNLYILPWNMNGRNMSSSVNLAMLYYLLPHCGGLIRYNPFFPNWCLAQNGSIIGCSNYCLLWDLGLFIILLILFVIIYILINWLTS